MQSMACAGGLRRCRRGSVRGGAAPHRVADGVRRGAGGGRLRGGAVVRRHSGGPGPSVDPGRGSRALSSPPPGFNYPPGGVGGGGSVESPAQRDISRATPGCHTRERPGKWQGPSCRPSCYRWEPLGIRVLADLSVTVVNCCPQWSKTDFPEGRLRVGAYAQMSIFRNKTGWAPLVLRSLGLTVAKPPLPGVKGGGEELHGKKKFQSKLQGKIAKKKLDAQ